MMILGLNTLGIIIETGLGIWIFSKAFPRRADDEWGWKEVVNEAVLHGIIIGLILLNFIPKWNASRKMLFCFGWVCVIVIYRNTIHTDKDILFKNMVLKINTCITVTEIFGMLIVLTWNYWDNYVSLGMVWLANIMLPFYIYKYYKCKFYEAYIYEVLYLSTVQILKCAYMVYKGVSEQQTLLVMNREGGMHTLEAVVCPILIYAIILFCVKNFSVDVVLRKAFEKYKKCIVLAAIVESVIFEIFTDLIGKGKIESSAATIVIVFVIIMFWVVLAVMITLFRKVTLAEQNILKVRNEAIEQQYRELRKAYEQNRCLIHDERHRMQYIDECLKNSDIERAREFVQNSHKDILAQKNHFKTGISTLDFILNMKIDKIEGVRAKLQLHVDLDRIPIEESDFVVLLGNLLDNAIEAVEKCSAENRIIELKIQQMNDMFLLSIKNTNVFLPEKKKGHFITTKKNKQGHGYGIQSSKYVVQKYGGEIDFTYDSSYFQVLLNISI